MDEVRVSETVYRVRIAHVHTLKDGWRLSETTVEAYGSDIDYDRIREESIEAYETGTREAQRRNQLERDYNRGVLSGPNSHQDRDGV